MPVPDLLEATRQVLENFMIDYSQEERKKYESAVQLLEKEAQEKKRIIEEGIQQMQNLKEKIQHQYDDYTKLAYKLHAVFIHQGQANYGHYWIYILDHKEDQWWKYNDSLVTKVHESEIYHDTTGSTANPYFLVYVDASKIDDCVETIVTRSRDSNNGLAVTATDPA
jgi:ubiquitin C-terminal hydrolase